MDRDTAAMPMAPVASPGASDGLLLRVGAVAAVGGAVASLIATVAEPDSSGDPTHAVRVVANSSVWTFDRLLDLIGALLLVGGLTVCRGTFAKNTASVDAFRMAIIVCGVLVAAGGAIGAIGIVDPPRKVEAKECPGGQLAGAPKPAVRPT